MKSEQKLALSYGYSIIKDEYRGDEFLSFKKGTFHVWMIKMNYTGKIMWQTASLIDGYYVNHNAYSTLKDALKAEVRRFELGKVYVYISYSCTVLYFCDEAYGKDTISVYYEDCCIPKTFCLERIGDIISEDIIELEF